jgi:pimeloyl-ACP methyl ester carboxylesterase
MSSLLPSEQNPVLGDGGATVERRSVAVAGREVVVSAREGRPLLFLLRMASRGMGVWDPVWDALADRFSVAQFDLRMPDAQALARPGDVFKAMAAECANAATALGHSDFHVFGWNGGTHVALRCAVDHPERVRSCLLLGPFCEVPDRRALDRGIEFLRVMLECGDRELYAYYWFMAGLSPRFVASHFDEVDRLVAARLAGDRFLALDVERAMAWIRALRGSYVTDAELARIKASTLVVAHSEDRWHAGPTVEMARAVHARIPNARFTLMQGFGSLVLLEAPEAFLASVKPFIDEVLGTERR